MTRKMDCHRRFRAQILSLDQIVGQQLASISLIPRGAPSGSEPFYRRVSGRLRLASQLGRRQNRSLTKPYRESFWASTPSSQRANPPPLPPPTFPVPLSRYYFFPHIVMKWRLDKITGTRDAAHYHACRI